MVSFHSYVIEPRPALCHVPSGGYGRSRSESFRPANRAMANISYCRIFVVTISPPSSFLNHPCLRLLAKGYHAYIAHGLHPKTMPRTCSECGAPCCTEFVSRGRFGCLIARAVGCAIELYPGQIGFVSYYRSRTFSHSCLIVASPFEMPRLKADVSGSTRLVRCTVVNTGILTVGAVSTVLHLG